MANSKISALTADATPSSDDLVVTVNDPGGTPANRKVTLANLPKGLGLASTDNVTFNSVNGLSITAAGNTFNLTQGTGSLDVAAGKTVNIDNDMTIQGDLTVSATCTIDQDLQQSASPTFNAVTVTSITDGTLTITGGAITGCGGLTITGDFTTTGAAIDWDLIDNNASALSFDASGQTGILEIDTTNSYEGLIRKGLKTVASSETVNDDATITLETGKAGWVEVQAGDDEEFMKCTFTTAGVVSLVHGTANTAITDSDTNLCVYDGGTGIVIKNRLGASKTVRYLAYYSA